MKLVMRNKMRTVEMQDILCGELFRIGRTLYMKCSCTNGHYNAVNIESGQLDYFHCNVQVVRMRLVIAMEVEDA